MFTDKTDFLVNTLEYYTEDTNRRCISIGGSCNYSPQNANKASISDGCAIGRWMTSENQLKADAHPSDSSVNILYQIDEYRDCLPSWLWNLEVNFLKRVQKLHDYNDGWNKEGLTEEGTTMVLDMIKEFNLDKDKLNRFL